MADTRDFLLEIGTEEMPSAPLANAASQLGPLVARLLDEAGLAHGAVQVLSSPRRLAALVSEVAFATDEVHNTLRGPAVTIAFDADGTPTKAAEGFARKCGLAATELIRRVDADGREYVFAEQVIAARSAFEILSEASEAAIAGLQWPNYRSQRWGSEHQSFVRPIRWICALLGTEVVRVRYADVVSGNLTYGHRVLAPGVHTVSDPATYEATLEAAGVLSGERRREAILAGIAEVEAARPGSRVDVPARVLDEVVNLCEWPSVIVGAFDEAFLAVPHEIICESMLSHQRYFPIYNAQGELTREFVIVSNTLPENAERVIEGNERVVRARLDDARFFVEEDLKQSLSDYLPRLATVTFQESLGSMEQKAQRMEALASFAADRCFSLPYDEQKLAGRAALLAKADLVTQAVVEFTSQQGVMGGHYALAAGENPEVARAISEQYRPRFAGDELPSNTLGKCVALADKIDTVCGMFAINQPPTGSSDPFAVRRSAIGCLALLRAGDAPAGSLAALVDRTLELLAEQGVEFETSSVRGEILNYFLGRLAAMAKEVGCAPDTVEAVRSVGAVDPVEFMGRVVALNEARRADPQTFEDLAAAYARASHLADAALGSNVNAEQLGEAEQALLFACNSGEQTVAQALAVRDYSSAISALAELRAPIDRFFDDVLVMDDDTTVRENRLRLLNRFVSVFVGVADMAALSRKK